MKKNILILLVLMLMISCTLINTETDITGIYLYTGTFISQRLFFNPDNVSEGDTVYSAGAVLLSWNVLQTLSGTEIRIDKSVGDNASYTNLKSVPVSSSSTVTDSILSGNDYYYKLTLVGSGNEKLMNEYKIVIPKLYFYSPDLSDLSISDDNFNIVFNDVNPEGQYKVILRDTTKQILWETITADTELIYSGTPLSTNIYFMEVSTSISDIEESQSVVMTTGITQFVIQ